MIHETDSLMKRQLIHKQKLFVLGVPSKKTNSIFTDIVQIGGQPHFKKIKRKDFLTKVGEGGGHKIYCQK